MNPKNNEYSWVKDLDELIHLLSTIKQMNERSAYPNCYLCEKTLTCLGDCDKEPNDFKYELKELNLPIEFQQIIKFH